MLADDNPFFEPIWDALGAAHVRAARVVFEGTAVWPSVLSWLRPR